MAEMPSGVQGSSNSGPATSGLSDSTPSTDNMTTGEALAASPTTGETLAGIERPSLESIMETIEQTPVLDPSLLPDDPDLNIERDGLINTMEQLEADRQQLLEDFNNGNFVSTQYSNHTLDGLDDYIADYNALAGAVSTYNGMANVGTTITHMQALPFQVAGSAILGVTALQGAQSAYTYALSNPVGVTTFADDFLSTLLVPGSPSPSAIGYGTGIGAAGAEFIADKLR